MTIKTKHPGLTEEDDTELLDDEDALAVDAEEDEDTTDSAEEAPSDEATDEGEDSHPVKHKNTFNKRINELTRKRRDAERERDAERVRVAELERRLKEVESFQSDAEVQAIEAKMVAMKQRLMAARAADDLDEEIAIQQEIAEASQRKMVHMARKAVNAAEQPQQQQTHQAPRRVLPEVDALIAANPWLLSPATPEQQQAAMIARSLANQLEAEGLDPYVDPEYAEQMEALLDEELSKRGIGVLQYTYNSQNGRSAAQKGNQQSQAGAAKAGSAKRGGISSSSSVKGASGPAFKLTAAQKELAKMAGMTEAKYAEYMLANKD